MILYSPIKSRILPALSLKEIKKMRIPLASIILLVSLISLEPAFSHSGGTDDFGCHAGSQTYHCHNEDDDDFGCAIAGFEEAHGSIVLNLFFIGLNIFKRED